LKGVVLSVWDSSGLPGFSPGSIPVWRKDSDAGRSAIRDRSPRFLLLAMLVGFFNLAPSESGITRHFEREATARRWS